MTQTRPMTTKEAAMRLGVSPRTLQRWAERKDISHGVSRTGRLRFGEHDLEEYEAACERRRREQHPEVETPNPRYRERDTVVQMRRRRPA